MKHTDSNTSQIGAVIDVMANSSFKNDQRMSEESSSCETTSQSRGDFISENESDFNSSSRDELPPVDGKREHDDSSKKIDRALSLKRHLKIKEREMKVKEKELKKRSLF